MNAKNANKKHAAALRRDHVQIEVRAREQANVAFDQQPSVRGIEDAQLAAGAQFHVRVRLRRRHLTPLAAPAVSRRRHSATHVCRAGT